LFLYLNQTTEIHRTRKNTDTKEEKNKIEKHIEKCTCKPTKILHVSSHCSVLNFDFAYATLKEHFILGPLVNIKDSQSTRQLNR